MKTKSLPSVKTKSSLSIDKIIRYIGFGLILVGVFAILFSVFFSTSMDDKKLPVFISLNFFIVMLGVAFVFPSLLQDSNKTVSTMRIVVFMFINVACMLFLKIGFSVGNLAEIRLDSNWVTLMAFAFGAKATQSFFERKLPGGGGVNSEEGEEKPEVTTEEKPEVTTTEEKPAETEEKPAEAEEVKPEEVKAEETKPEDAQTAETKPEETQTTCQYTEEEITDWAIAQNQTYLLSKKNVRLIVHGKKVNSAGVLQDCVSIHLKDTDHTGIPDKLYVKIPGVVDTFVETEIIDDVQKPQISYSAGDSIANSKSASYQGSVACKLQLSDKTECLLTCSHVMNSGQYYSMNGYFSNTDDTIINKINDGKWFYGFQSAELDIALIKDFDTDNFSYLDNQPVAGVRPLKVSDIKTTKMRMIGRKDFYPNNNVIEGYVINERAVLPISISYNGHDYPINNLIILSKSRQEPYECLSQPGDSGSLIVDANNVAVGMLIGQNSKFSYAISMNKIVSQLNAQLV